MHEPRRRLLRHTVKVSDRRSKKVEDEPWYLLSRSTTEEGKKRYPPVLAHLGGISGKNNPSQSRTLPSSGKIFRCLAPKTRYSRVAPYFKLVEVFLRKTIPVVLRTPI